MSNQPKFKINPSLRLRSKYFSIVWQEVDDETLSFESSFCNPSREFLVKKGRTEIICQKDSDTFIIYYANGISWDNRSIQKWLRQSIKKAIMAVAERVLPQRLHELESQKRLYSKSVVIKSLRKNVLGQCSYDNIIYLPHKLILLPDEYIDSVILHEMAHIKYKHHRKSFWNYLSQLLGEDSVRQKKLDIILANYFVYADFLMKK